MDSKRVAYLTMHDAGDFVTDFHLSFAPMQALGWDTEAIDWRSKPDWSAFDAVYICTPWDYPQHPHEFMQVLESIDASAAVLLNELALVRWNIEKTYLRDIAARGDDIVPTTWYECIEDADVEQFFSEHNVPRVVVKPTIGGNAVDTFVLTDPIDDTLRLTLQKTFLRRRFMVQPFVDSIVSEGEYSLFFFGGEYSHAIQKTPAAGDFRVQEEHGAAIDACTPPEELRKAAARVFTHIEPLPVYGRGDWVRGDDGRYLLMELELIEPSLYLRTDGGAALRFARAFDQRFKELTGK